MIGQMVSKYRILEEIGRGAMGIVFKAQDTFLGRFVALKILAEKLVNDPQMLGRFEREGGAASALNHPNICTVFETGNWKGRPYLAMELLERGSLDDRITKLGKLTEAELFAIWKAGNPDVQKELKKKKIFFGINKEMAKIFALGASLILFAGIVFYLVAPKWH